MTTVMQMMKIADRVSDFFWRLAGWKAFAVAFLFYAVMGFYIMPHGASTIQQLAGKPVRIMDLQFSYTPEKAKAIISEYMPEAREQSARFSAIADSIYPFAYTFLYIVATAWVFKSGGRHGVVINHLHLLPFGAFFIDFCENASIIHLMHTYPDFTDSSVLIASFFTSLKWTLCAAQTLVLLGGIALLISDKFRKQS